MSGPFQRRELLTPAALIMTTVVAARQQAAAQQATRLQAFPTPEAAATALTDAVRSVNDKALAAMLGEDWNVFAPTRDRDFGIDRDAYLAAWQAGNKAIVDGAKATIEVGTDGWTLPLPLMEPNGASTSPRAVRRWRRASSAATNWAPSRHCWRSAMPNANMSISTR